METIKKISFDELRKLGFEKQWRKAVIVFKPDAFLKSYSLEERSYEVLRKNHMFNKHSISDGLYGNCLDGRDLSVRLDRFMFAERNAWPVDYCYIVE